VDRVYAPVKEAGEEAAALGVHQGVEGRGAVEQDKKRGRCRQGMGPSHRAGRLGGGRLMML
jgi:hypothetical protein